MPSQTFLDSAASVAAVAAMGGLLYARVSARSAHEAADAARRSVEIAERSRQAAARARLRLHVERVGVLVTEIAASSQADTATNELSQKTKTQCRALNRAVIGIKDIVPKSVEVCHASSVPEVNQRATDAGLEIDELLQKLNSHRSRSAYRPRHQVPWNRPAGARSNVAAGARARGQVTRPPSP